MLLVTQLDGHHEEIEVNRRLMLLVAQLDGHHEEIEVNRWQMLLRFNAKFV
jgi:ATP-dependent 26S proteasome regulatory subunit